MSKHYIRASNIIRALLLYTFGVFLSDRKCRSMLSLVVTWNPHQGWWTVAFHFKGQFRYMRVHRFQVGWYFIMFRDEVDEGPLLLYNLRGNSPFLERMLLYLVCWPCLKSYCALVADENCPLYLVLNCYIIFIIEYIGFLYRFDENYM